MKVVRNALLQKLRRVRVKNQRSREGINPAAGCYHGDASEAPPTDVGAVLKKKGKRRGGREREKMKKSRNEPLNGEERKTDETGMETLSGMVAWQEMGVPLPIIKALKDLGFTSPTAIQQQAIPVAMDTTSDIIGAAETVSFRVYFIKGKQGTQYFTYPRIPQTFHQ